MHLKSFFWNSSWASVSSYKETSNPEFSTLNMSERPIWISLKNLSLMHTVCSIRAIGWEVFHVKIFRNSSPDQNTITSNVYVYLHIQTSQTSICDNICNTYVSRIKPLSHRSRSGLRWMSTSSFSDGRPGPQTKVISTHLPHYYHTFYQHKILHVRDCATCWWIIF